MWRGSRGLESRSSAHSGFLAHDGQDLTPLGRKARALLAILALTPARRRSRPALQDKLWSDRGAEQGAASLRQTLTEIRKALGERYRDCLVSDLHGIGFAAGRVTVDLDDVDVSELARLVEPPQLLEDIDVADEEFEDWLRNQRAAFGRRIAASRAAPDTVSSDPDPDDSTSKPPPKTRCEPAALPRRTATADRPSLGSALAAGDGQQRGRAVSVQAGRQPRRAGAQGSMGNRHPRRRKGAAGCSGARRCAADLAGRRPSISFY